MHQPVRRSVHIPLCNCRETENKKKQRREKYRDTKFRGTNLEHLTTGGTVLASFTGLASTGVGTGSFSSRTRISDHPGLTCWTLMCFKKLSPKGSCISDYTIHCKAIDMEQSVSRNVVTLLSFSGRLSPARHLHSVQYLNKQTTRHVHINHAGYKGMCKNENWI